MTRDRECERATDNSLQKSIALTPRAPNAGPTGGDGVALPAGTRIFYKEGTNGWTGQRAR